MINRFIHTASAYFLCTLSLTPKTSELFSEAFIQLSDEDYNLFQKLSKETQKVVLAVKAIKGQKSNNLDDLEENNKF